VTFPSWLPSLGGRRARAISIAWPVVAAFAIAIVTWQTTTLTATAGLDPSWIAALHLAQVKGIDFGSDFVWTYGPLGYLAFPVAVTGQTLAEAFVFVLLAQVAVCYLLLRCAARALIAPVAVVVVYLVAALPLAHADLLFVIVFLYALWVLEEPGTQLAHWFPVAGGVLAGAAALTKTNTGAAAVGIAVVAAWAVSPAGRRWLAVVPSILLTFAVLWVATGNSLLDIPGWLKLSASIVAGYSPAMQYEQAGMRWEYLVAGILVALLAAIAVPHVAAFERKRGLAVLLITLVFVFTYFKEGFVRHDTDHSPYFFAATAIVLLAFAWRGWARWVAVGGVAIALGAVAVSIGLHFSPIASSRHILRQTEDVVSPSKRHALVAKSLAVERATYGVPPRLLAELRGKTVHVDPVESAVIGAYDLQWRPLPVPQSYSAYTSALDDRNANFLASGSAPERILRQNTQVAVNGRNRELEAPAAFRALICNYTQIGISQVWQVLAHTGPRCGTERKLASARLVSGQPVSVPQGAPDELVYARISLRDTLVNRVVSLAYKPRTPAISLGGGAFVPLVLATARDGIVVHVPPSAGFDPRFNGADDWNLIAVHTIAGSATVDFYAVHVRGTPGTPFGEAPRAPLPHYTLVEVMGHEAVRGPDGRTAPVETGGGYLDAAYLVGSHFSLGGWAAEAGSGTVASKILVFVAGKLVFAGAPNVDRPDVAAAFNLPSLRRSGFAVVLSRDQVMDGSMPRNVRVFALLGERVLEVTYPLDDPWHP